MRILRRMPGRTAALLALACGLTSLIAAQPASAGAARPPRPGQWTQVTGKLSNIDDVGLARGGGWQLGAVTSTTFNWQSSESAAPGTGGTPWTDFDNANGIAVHHTGSLTAKVSFHTCCVNSAGIGTDSRTGAAWITYRSFVQAQARKVDVVALLTVHGTTAYWTTQVLPPRQ